MLKVLRDVIKNLYYPLQSQGNWNSAFIDKPVAERIWMQIDEYRISLNKIYPCDANEAFRHPCNSAVLICSGECECLVGDSLAYGVGPFYFPQWSAYQITNSRQEHSIRPVKEPVLTIMITKTAQITNSTHRVLTKQEFDPIFDYFKSSENRVKMLDVLDRWIGK